MKIYTLDHGWAGSVVVIETSKESALALMKEKHPDTCDADFHRIDESEIVAGFAFYNMGDL